MLHRFNKFLNLRFLWGALCGLFKYTAYIVIAFLFSLQLYFLLLGIALTKLDPIIEKNAPLVDRDIDYSKYNILIMHGLSSNTKHTKFIADHLGPTAYNPLLLYHEADLKRLDEIKTDRIKEQFINALEQMMNGKEVGFLIAHSYSAGIAIELSMDGKLPKGLKLILLAPMIRMHATYRDMFTALNSILQLKYLALFNVETIPEILWRTKLFTDMSPETMPVYRRFIEKSTLFTRNGLHEARSTGESIFGKYHAGVRMKNEFILLLCGNDMCVCNDTAKLVLSSDPLCKETIYFPDFPHQPHSSGRALVKQQWLEAIADSVKKLS